MFTCTLDDVHPLAHCVTKVVWRRHTGIWRTTITAALKQLHLQRQVLSRDGDHNDQLIKSNTKLMTSTWQWFSGYQSISGYPSYPWLRVTGYSRVVVSGRITLYVHTRWKLETSTLLWWWAMVGRLIGLDQSLGRSRRLSLRVWVSNFEFWWDRRPR